MLVMKGILHYKFNYIFTRAYYKYLSCFIQIVYALSPTAYVTEGRRVYVQFKKIYILYIVLLKTRAQIFCMT